MIRSSSLSNNLIDSLLQLPEVIRAKDQIDVQTGSGSIYINACLDASVKQDISEQLGLPLSGLETIPMRWIKGDTKPHIDKAARSFEKTHLTYLTSSEGSLIIDGDSYPIARGQGYVFDENVSHETIGTGTEPRLLLGPMSEQGFAVGGGTIINADGETEIIYFKYTEGFGVEYKINVDGSYSGVSLPITITNTNTSYTLKVLFETDMTLYSNIWYFICGSSNIQFGSESLNTDGSRPVITIDGVTNYPGFIKNGNNVGNGNDNIYVYNLEVNAINGSTLVADGGWIGQSYFGKGASRNYIVNCSSSGPIIDGGGGILGGYSGSASGATMYITGCSSDGNMGDYSGGIIGFYAGVLAGNVICESCWSTGLIGPSAGGIVGYKAGNLGSVTAVNCYSTGLIGQYGGGIIGGYAGDNGIAQATTCYSTGNITADGGGIFGFYAGANSGTTPATNCYTVGTFSVIGTGIYGVNAVDDSPSNCYSANGSWSNTTANTQLTGDPNPIVGTVWVNRGVNTPYELYSMGYTPYTIENIVLIEGDPTLNRNYSVTGSQGQTVSPGLIDDLSYSILQINDSDPSAYSSITINSVTGAISTTAETTLGVYTLYIRNEGSYNITTVELTVTETSNTPICFPAGTLVLTDQGEIAIEKLNVKKHTISGKKIVAVTQTIPLDKYLICIEKNSLGYNVPNKKTLISKTHKIMVDKKLMESEKLVQYVPTIYKVPYDKKVLYNVLLENYSVMTVNNLIVETLHPNNIIAKIYNGDYSPEQKNKLIQLVNTYTRRSTENSKKKLIYNM